MLKQTEFSIGSFGNSSAITMRRVFRSSVYIVSVLLLLSVFCLIYPPVHNDSSYAITGTSIASDTTLSLAIENGTLSLDFTPTSQSGTFTSTTTPAVVKVSTNNITGYTLGIKSSDPNAANADKLVNTDTTITAKNTIESITSSVSKSDYENNNIENMDLNNTWGYSPSYYNSTINTLEATDNNPFYYPAPVAGDIINVTSGPNPVSDTNSNSDSDSDSESLTKGGEELEASNVLQEDEYTINFGARLDYSIYSGTYTNPTTFIITAVGNPVPYSISYDSNIPAYATANNGEVYNMPTAQTGSINTGDTIAVVLSTKEPVIKDITTNNLLDYALAGWCSEPTEIINDGTNKDYQKCPEEATLYQPGDSFGIDQTAENHQMLYAVWSYATIITFDPNAPIEEISGEMQEQRIAGGRTVTLDTNEYIRVGYIFTEWNTAANGSGVSYDNKSDYIASNMATENITLYAQWETPCNANSVCYLPNGANTGEGSNTMGNQTVSSNAEITFWPTNYKYDTDGDGYNDYGFAGWSEDKNAATKLLDLDATNDPLVYGPNQDVVIGDVSEQGMKLYAVWMPVAKDSNNEELTFQTANLLTATLSDGTTLADKPIKYVTALRDYRDNQVYAVAKLADENYWMIENLRLESDATVGSNKNDSGITNQSLAEGYAEGFVGLADAESSNFSANTTANSLYSTNNITGNDQDYRFPRYNNINTAASTATADMTIFNNNGNIYSLGNYYTWAAAIADTAAYNSSSNNHTDVHTSICPTGWHLPYGDTGTSSPSLGNTKGGFYYLGVKLGATSSNTSSSKRWRSFPNNFVYSGYFKGARAGNRSIDGSYWSTSAVTNGYACRMNLLSNYVNPGFGSDDKYAGNSVRCVAK